jgi:hypothetical protein
MSSFWRGLVIQWRVVGALIVERLSSAIAFSSSRRPHIVVHTCERAAALPSAGHHFRHFSRACFVGDLLEPHRASVSFAVFYAIGALDVPRDLPMFYLGYFYMIWWSVAVALIVGALCERKDWVQQVWMPYSYLYMMFSGSLSRGLATTIPPQGSVVPALYSGVRDDSRRGLWHDDYDLWRPSLYHVRPRNLTLFGLWLTRDSRKYVVIE